MKVHLSCLVDHDPKFAIQAFNWVTSLKATGTAATPFICSVDGALSPSQRRSFENLGARVLDAERFGDGRAAYCNKISQLFVDDVLDCDWLILSDADIGFLAPPEQMINEKPLRAKLVDFPNPELSDIEGWLNAIGVPWFGDAYADFAHVSHHKRTKVTALIEILKKKAGLANIDKVKRKTLAHNYNGGLYVIRRQDVEALRTSWSDYARKLLAAAPADVSWAKHADQIGFACAVHDLGLEVSELESGWNFPTHFSPRTYKMAASTQRLLGLHYHDCMDNHGMPERVGVPWIDDPLNTLRKNIVAGRREQFDNEIFWNYRYKYFPELGSGLGSRGETLAQKQTIVAPAFQEFTGCSVVDVGCGDLEFVRDQAFGNYLGLDVSEEAIATAKAKRPEWSFRIDRIDTVDDASFDFALCMDVLIHQPNTAAARALVDDLLRVARKGVVLSIHADPQVNSGISFNTFDLRTYLEDHPATRAVLPLGKFRDTEVFAISKAEGIFENL